MMVCAEMNTMWITAESLAQSRDFARAFDLYKYIVTTCEDPNERLSTVQKASLLLPEAGTRSLVALGNILPDGTGEFDNVSFDLVRRKMGLVAQGNSPASALTMDELQRFSDFVQRSFSADDAELFGWFYYGQQSWEASYHWFVSATRMTSSVKSIEGVILTLRNLQHRDEALALARQYATQTPELKKIYIELVSAGLTDQETPLAVDEKELKTFETYVFEQKSALGAQALGWHRLENKNSKDAARLFEQSIEWEPTEGGVVGLAVLASRAKNWGRVAAIKKQYGEEFAALEDVKVYRPKVIARKPTPKPKEKPNLLTWLLQKDKRDEKKGRVEVE
jgi:cellulose synthase operon protein C